MVPNGAGPLYFCKRCGAASLGVSSHQSLPREHSLWDPSNRRRGGGLLAENFKSNGGNRQVLPNAWPHQRGWVAHQRLCCCGCWWRSSFRSSLALFAVMNCEKQSGLGCLDSPGLLGRVFLLPPWPFLPCQLIILFTLHTPTHVRNCPCFGRTFCRRSRQQPFCNFLQVRLLLTSAVRSTAGRGVGNYCREKRPRRVQWSNTKPKHKNLCNLFDRPVLSSRSRMRTICVIFNVPGSHIKKAKTHGSNELSISLCNAMYLKYRCFNIQWMWRWLMRYFISFLH